LYHKTNPFGPSVFLRRFTPGFIGTPEYEAHKEERFGSDDRRVVNSGAFSLTADAERKEFEAGYTKTRALYYRDEPSLTKILERVKTVLERL
jgi:hypothetical protein